MVYDHAARRYDHHQRGFAEVYDDEMTRKCGRPLKMASTGLLWRHYGPAIVRALWPAPRAGQQHCVAAPSATDVALVVRRVYTTLLAAIDADDNGLEAYAPDAFAGGVPPTPLYRDGTGLARRVDRLNVAWNEALTPGLADTRFAAAVALAGADFTAVLEGIVLSWLPARQVVADAYGRRRTYRANGHVLVNDVGGCPYRDHLRDIERDAAHAGAAHAEPAVLYVVSWDRVRCQWSATATEARPGSFESKLAFPPACLHQRTSACPGASESVGRRCEDAARPTRSAAGCVSTRKPVSVCVRLRGAARASALCASKHARKRRNSCVATKTSGSTSASHFLGRVAPFSPDVLALHDR